jgi:hypothetical protein
MNTQGETSRKIRKRVNDLLAMYLPAGPFASADLINGLNELVTEFEPIIAGSLADSITENYLAGAVKSVNQLPSLPSIAGGGSPPSIVTSLLAGGDETPRPIFDSIVEAAKSLSSKQVMDPGRFYALSAEARQRAFTISGDITQASRLKIGQLLEQNVGQAPSLREFQKQARAIVDELPISDSHLEQVFRNNVHEAFSAGREAVLSDPMVADAFPYRLFSPVVDARARKDHVALARLGLNGTAVFHKDDPTWLRFRPPFAWNCRCGWVAISIAVAARRGVKEAQEWLDTGTEPVHVWVTPPPFSPPPQWDRTRLAA